MNHENGKMSPYIEFEEKKKNIEHSILAQDTIDPGEMSKIHVVRQVLIGNSGRSTETGKY